MSNKPGPWISYEDVPPRLIFWGPRYHHASVVVVPRDGSRGLGALVQEWVAVKLLDGDDGRGLRIPGHFEDCLLLSLFWDHEPGSDRAYSFGAGTHAWSPSFGWLSCVFEGVNRPLEDAGRFFPIPDVADSVRRLMLRHDSSDESSEEVVRSEPFQDLFLRAGDHLTVLSVMSG